MDLANSWAIFNDSFWSEGVWVIFGVLTGALLSPLIDWLKYKSQKSTRQKKLKFELEAFKSIVNEWDKDLSQLIYEIATNGKQKYIPYIPLARVFTPTFAEMIRTGEVYDYLDDYKDIKLLLWLVNVYSEQGQNYINTKMNEFSNKPNELSQVAAKHQVDFKATNELITKILNKIK